MNNARSGSAVIFQIKIKVFQIQSLSVMIKIFDLVLLNWWRYCCYADRLLLQHGGTICRLWFVECPTQMCSHYIMLILWLYRLWFRAIFPSLSKQCSWGFWCFISFQMEDKWHLTRHSNAKPTTQRHLGQTNKFCWPKAQQPLTHTHTHPLHRSLVKRKQLICLRR